MRSNVELVLLNAGDAFLLGAVGGFGPTFGLGCDEGTLRVASTGRLFLTLGGGELLLSGARGIAEVLRKLAGREIVLAEVGETLGRRWLITLSADDVRGAP